MGRKNHGYEIYKKYEIKEIFEYLENNNTLPDNLIYGDNDLKDSIRRVQIIKNLLNRDGELCINCKSEPKYFALGKDKINRWHLDLYGGDMIDDDHMFTIDHIHPRSKGGENKLDNYQLLCKICNEDKSDSVNGEKSTKKINASRYYIDKKLTSLSEQIKGVFTKIKSKELICINKQEGFTIGNEYRVLDIKLKINKKFEIKYYLITINDDGLKVTIPFTNFITKIDYIHLKK